jgi:uncharacterized protein YjbI with pentapeptide repeats
MEPFEPPKYIASLIAAINDGAKSAQLGALAFTAIGLFLLATAFSATDEDLLLNHAITISQLGGAAVPVVLSFGLAPAVFLAAHLYTLIRYDMLAGNVRRFMVDLPAMVPVEADRERCRQLLANVEFVNVLVMPPRSRASSWLFRWTVRFMLAVFPVAVLLLVQISSLRLQHEVVNWVHHVCLLVDLVLLVWFFGRQGADGDCGFWTAPLRRKVAMCWSPLVILLMALAWLRVPDADSDTVGKDILKYALRGAPSPYESPWTRMLLALPVQPIDLILCPHIRWGCRFLTVAHRPLVAKVWDAKAFVELRGGADADEQHLAAIEGADLRERVLRFAVLTGSELFAADLTGAQLQHAELTSAVLKYAQLDAAQLQGADLLAARLQGANLAGAQLQGADMIGSQLQGVDLGGAKLQGANLAYGQLQGANLVGAQLQGAILIGAQLQGANLADAKLQGANLSLGQLQGAGLRNAGLYNVVAIRDTEMGLVDMRGAVFTAVSARDVRDALPAGTPRVARQRVEDALTPRIGADALPRVETSRGPILVGNSDDPAWRNNQGQLITDPAVIDPKLAELLADEVAPRAPRAAEQVVGRVLYPAEEDRGRPLIKLLSCRLQNRAKAGGVTLPAETVADLRKATGSCGEIAP